MSTKVGLRLLRKYGYGFKRRKALLTGLYKLWSPAWNSDVLHAGHTSSCLKCWHWKKNWAMQIHLIWLYCLEILGWNVSVNHCLYICVSPVVDWWLVQVMPLAQYAQLSLYIVVSNDIPVISCPFCVGFKLCIHIKGIPTTQLMLGIWRRKYSCCHGLMSHLSTQFVWQL